MKKDPLLPLAALVLSGLALFGGVPVSAAEPPAFSPEAAAVVPSQAALAASPVFGTASERYLSGPVARTRPALPASWKWSLAPLVASQALDIASSYGMQELNPVLAGANGQFGIKSTLTKAGATAAFIGLEYLIVKAHPGAARIFTRMNWGGAALTTGFAAHNFSIR